MNYADYEIDKFLDQRRRQVHIHITVHQLYNTRLISDEKLSMWCDQVLLIHRLFPDLVAQGYEYKMFMTWPSHQLSPTVYSRAIAAQLVRLSKEWL